jgi:hypothetical protein
LGFENKAWIEPPYNASQLGGLTGKLSAKDVNLQSVSFAIANWLQVDTIPAR